MICPKCEYERTPEDRAPAAECPRCGLVYAKWHARAEGLVAAAPDASVLVRLARALVAVKPSVGPVTFWGHVAVYAIFFLWGWTFVLADFRSAEAVGMAGG